MAIYKIDIIFQIFYLIWLVSDRPKPTFCHSGCLFFGIPESITLKDFTSGGKIPGFEKNVDPGNDGFMSFRLIVIIDDRF